MLLGGCSAQPLIAHEKSAFCSTETLAGAQCLIVSCRTVPGQGHTQPSMSHAGQWPSGASCGSSASSNSRRVGLSLSRHLAEFSPRWAERERNGGRGEWEFITVQASFEHSSLLKPGMGLPLAGTRIVAFPLDEREPPKHIILPPPHHSRSRHCTCSFSRCGSRQPLLHTQYLPYLY